MAYNARVFRIFIASPSDVEEEREVIARIIREWNDLNSFDRKVVLLPLRWETHAAPELGKRPQEIINTEIVDQADMAVGVFWTRIGTPTGGFESGTIEEIERLGKAGKIVMCYFSKAKVELEKVDLDQYKSLKEFKKKTYPNGLVENYSNVVEFRDLLAKQLEIKIRTLIAKDSEKEEDFSNNSSVPNLEFEFINPYTEESNGIEFTAKSRILTFDESQLAELPDYVVEERKKDLFISVNKNYYRDYIEFVKEDWYLIPIKFFLKNPMPIAIRDIFIEITCQKSDNFIVTRNKISKPEPTKGGFSIDLGSSFAALIGKSTLNIEDNDGKYRIQLTCEALQPQRTLVIQHPLYIGGQKRQPIDFQVNIYADCFPKPITKTLKIHIEPTKIKRTPLELLTELEIFKKE